MGRLCSSPASWEWRPAASTRPPSTPSRSVTSISGRTCTPTPSCPEAPPCTPVLLTVCRRRSLPWPPPPSRSRSSLPPRGSTPSGSEAPSWPPSPPSSRVDLQAGVRRVRPLHRAQEVLLSVIILSLIAQTTDHSQRSLCAIKYTSFVQH